MAKLKFKDENNEFIPVVQDVKVNGSSVFDGKEAEIRLKTINDENIIGDGNINIQGEYEIEAEMSSGSLYISDTDLAYIREYMPPVLSVNIESVGNHILVLTSKTYALKYTSTFGFDSNTIYSYELEISSSDTYASGCAFVIRQYRFSQQSAVGE